AGAQTTDQVDFKKTFQDAEDLIGGGNYEAALPLFMKLYNKDTTNANLAFKIGVCLFNSYSFNFPIDQEKSLTYFSKALNNTTHDYKTGHYKERKAPVDAYFYLAEAFHFLHSIDSAEYYFSMFREMIMKTDPELVAEVDHRLEQCTNARELMANPLPVFITNLGARINSAYNDYAPVISADETTLIFTSTRQGSTGEHITAEGQYYEDIYISHRVGRAWSTPATISDMINTDNHEASISLSPDGNTLFIYKAEGEDGNIFQSKRYGEAWTTPERLSANINSFDYESHASLTEDGQSLYFTSDRPGGHGGLDIYVSRMQPDGFWGKAENLGPGVNTEFDDDSPFIHPDGKTLYFSSKGHKSMGGMDIFKSVIQNDGTWGGAENLGYPINTAADNIYYVINRKNTHAYFASVRENGYGGLDLYRIVISEDEVDAEFTEEEIADGENLVEPGTSDPDNSGNPGTNANNTSNKPKTDKIEPKDGKDTMANNLPADVKPEKSEPEAPLSWEVLYFEYNIGRLNVQSVEKVKHIREILTSHPDMKVEISGHTDNVGSDGYNMTLSKTRAQAVADYFVRNGVDIKRLVVIGLGESKPAKPNDTPENRAKNRRVEVKVIN
ncbi:MAG: PD40 domain-containing protein, partial [Flavobacteriales bacterium]|nr:PD40 domain-containing protein [Flavobacteriales bacterium]